MNNASDDGPRIFTDEEATVWEEYLLEDAWRESLERWQETKALQNTGDAQLSLFYQTRPKALELSKRFTNDYEEARRKHDAQPSDATRKDLAEAAQRCELVSCDHPPIDQELNAEFDALDPAIRAVEAAICALNELEEKAQRDGRTVWYRSRGGLRGDYSSALRRYVPELENPDSPTRGKRLLFDRRGADPMVALIFAREALSTVRPVTPERGKSSSHSYRHVDEMLSWVGPSTFDLKLADVSQLLRELGYPARTYNLASLTRRLHDGSKRGDLELPQDSKLGRPRASVAAARERRRERRHRKTP